MADLTLLEAAKLSTDVVDRAVTRIIVEASPMLELCPQRQINGPTYRYNLESDLGGVAFRAVNGSYTPATGVINPQYESLAIMGGEVKIDNYIVDVQSNAIAAKAQYYAMKARAMGLYYSEQFVEGDTAVTPYGFDGLRKRLTGNQLINAGTGGATLTLSMVDQLLDSVVGDNGQKVLFMNKTLRRKITELCRAQTGTSRIEYSQGEFNRQHTMYAGCPIRIVEREDTAATFLDFDEADGSGNNDTASIYCVRFGMEFVHGIMHGSIPAVKDFGEVQAGPYHLGRIEAYMGVVVKHPRSASRLYRLNNA